MAERNRVTYVRGRSNIAILGENYSIWDGKKGGGGERVGGEKVKKIGERYYLIGRKKLVRYIRGRSNAGILGENYAIWDGKKGGGRG